MEFLQWSLRVPKKDEQALWRIYRRTGVMPKPLQDKPELFPYNFDIWDAFCFLSEGRTHGMNAMNPIQLTEMVAYMDFKGISGHDNRAEFVEYIRAADRAFVSYQNDRAEDARRRAEEKAKASRSR